MGLPLYPGWETVLSAASQNPRYEAHENPPLPASLGFAAQFSVIASVTLLVTPVVVAKASGRDDSYLVWMVFASLLVAGVSTLVQVRRVGPVGAGAVLPMFTAAFSIPFCISAVAGRGAGDADHPGHRLRDWPDCHLQVAVSSCGVSSRLPWAERC